MLEKKLAVKRVSCHRKKKEQRQRLPVPQDPVLLQAQVTRGLAQQPQAPNPGPWLQPESRLRGCSDTPEQVQGRAPSQALWTCFKGLWETRAGVLS